MLQLLWLLPLLPFAGFVVIGLLGPRLLPRRAVAALGCGTVLAALVLSAGAVAKLSSLSSAAGLMEAFGAGEIALHDVTWTSLPPAVIDAAAGRASQDLFAWIAPGQVTPSGPELRVPWTMTLDPLASVMVLVVTGIGFLIHVYAIGYMAHEPPAAFARFFSYLNLFTAMMLTLVLGGSLPVVFVGWEGVGLCSYLLIGFYYDRMFDEKKRMSCADAGRKAFIVNRVGDMGFFLAMLVLLRAAGTLDIQSIVVRAEALGPGICTAAALLLFLGVCGKSAQIPLYVWLPDAMAGPTPVSALIHAATMVTAGVYLMARMAPVYAMAPLALLIVAVVGAATALLAALVATAQDDIKKVLAYSTVSQLGYMVMAAGVGAFTASIFHLVTHAFFKALLFLGAGAVIHALSGEQDIQRMGGLRRALPVTHATFLVAVGAIAGLPPSSGFFSKDAILWAAYQAHPLLWGVGVLVAGLTAFYMTRLYALVFAGAPRLGEAARGHLHEAPPSMALPLVVLALGAALAGFLSVPGFLSAGRMPDVLGDWLAPVLRGAESAAGAMMGHAPVAEAGHLAAAGTAAAESGHAATDGGHAAAEAAAALGTLLAAMAGIAVAWRMYGRPRSYPTAAAAPGALLRWAREEAYADRAIEALVLRPWRALCRAAAVFDARVVDGTVNAVAFVTDLTAQTARMIQTGSVRNYAFVFFLGTVVILACVLPLVLR